MSPGIAEQVRELILLRIGVAVQAEHHRDRNGDRLEVWPDGFHPDESFRLIFRPGFRSAEAEFVVGSFAAPVLNAVAQAPSEARLAALAFFEGFRRDGLAGTFRLNGADMVSAAAWPTAVNSLALSVRQRALVFNQASDPEVLALVYRLVVPLFGAIAALIGVEEAEESPFAGLPEGRPVQSLVTRYERKRVNREACLRANGTDCKVCGFSFLQHFGDIGSGYIEVHHIESLAEVGEEHHIDPAADLIPLCSNCHAMAHRRSPPFTPNELRAFRDAAKGGGRS